VLDLCSGGDLFYEISRFVSFSEYDAVDIIRQMLAAVKYLHANGFVHRDIKAENFMFKRQSQHFPLLMIDFGLATNFSKGDILTAVCGSPRYIAPEVLRRAYTEKCDIWSLGVVVYLMLFGVHPFGGWKGATFEQIASDVINADITFTPRNGGVSPSDKVPLSRLLKDF
ncbi:ULK kinase, putative, partial [Eimeria acervulina]